MNFEIRDGKEPIPDEDDIYGVNDIEERDQFNALFGGVTQEERVRRGKARFRILAALVILAFLLAFGVFGLRHIFGW